MKGGKVESCSRIKDGNGRLADRERIKCEGSESSIFNICII